MIHDNATYAELVEYLFNIFAGTVPTESHLFFAREGIPTRAACYAKMGNVSGWTDRQKFNMLRTDVENFVPTGGVS